VSAGFLARHADARVCDLETTGRVSGRPRRIEIWFATDGRRLYVLSGGRDRAHWVRNLLADPRVRVHGGADVASGTARVIEGDADEQEVRELVAAKYQGWRPDRSLSGWARTSLPVAITLDPDAA
jgi:deazaflavin-dependent oxidoreductase (nitroreductase family)